MFETIHKVYGIHLHHTILSVEKMKFLTAGIVCYSVEPKTQNIYVLLGQETCFYNLSLDRGVWCDFGGKIDPGEDILDAAAREFSEESLCTIKLFGSKQHIMSSDYIKEVRQMLANEDYFLKVSVILPPEDIRERVKVYFLKEIPWQPNLPQRFNKTRDLFLNVLDNSNHTIPYYARHHPGLDFVSKGKVLANKHFIEKFAVQWWSLERLREVLHYKRQFKNIRFRTSFIPVLKIIIKQLTQSTRPTQSRHK